MGGAFYTSGRSAGCGWSFGFFPLPGIDAVFNAVKRALLQELTDFHTEINSVVLNRSMFFLFKCHSRALYIAISFIFHI